MALRFSAGRTVQGADTIAITLIGLAWGLFVWWGDQWTWTPIQSVANLQGPWLLLAFFAGARSRVATISALYGFLILLAAVIGYYAARALLAGDASPAITAGDLITWLIVAIPTGIVGGLLGTLWRGRSDWPAVFGVALIAGALFGEALHLINRDGGAQFLTISVPIIEIAVAFSLPTALLPRNRALQAIPLTAILGPLALVAHDYLTDSLDSLLP